MPCPYCDDSHSAFDPCPQSIKAILENNKPPKEFNDMILEITKKPEKKRRDAASRSE